MAYLRRRLLFSHLLLLGVTIAAITISLTLILATRPAPEQPVWQSLASLATQLEFRANEPISILGLEQRLRAFAAQLSAFAETHDVRALVVRTPDQTVLFDSAGRFASGARLPGDLDAVTLATQPRRGILNVASGVVGSFTVENREWLFVGVDALAFRGSTYLVLLAEPRPTLAFSVALEQFGAEMIPAVLQALLIGGVIAVLMAVWVSRSIARPLQQLAAGAASVAQGNYAVRVPVRGVYELRAVAEAFNAMAERVRDEQQAQQDFLANVSHDLKTPLTSIQGFSQAIIDGAASNPVQAARIIYDEAARLNRMVVDLTDLARLQAGRMSMHITPLDLELLIRSIGERLAIVAREKGVTLDVHVQPVPDVAGDGDRLAQVLTNLISNAIKFTPAGGTIRVLLQPANRGVELRISDTGIGIPPGELPRIFERFYQVDKARGPARGTGLGLAIVHEIVAAHGGMITVTSAGENMGTTFSIWLPLAAAEPTALPARSRRLPQPTAS